MRECNLLKAVKRAAFRYLLGLLMNRVGKLLVGKRNLKRTLAALAALGGAALADRLLLPIGGLTGLVVAIGIVIWSLCDIVKTIKYVIERFRKGIGRAFKNLPQRLLDDPFLLDCVNRKPECCELFQREVSKLLVEWVKGLQPGWKGHAGGLGSREKKWDRMVEDIQQKIADPLRACCTR